VFIVVAPTWQPAAGLRFVNVHILGVYKLETTASVYLHFRSLSMTMPSIF
jgi:hypothetical protein